MDSKKKHQSQSTGNGGAAATSAFGISRNNERSTAGDFPPLRYVCR